MTPPMTILRADYLQILEGLITPEVATELQKKKKGKITRSTKFCAAKLIQIFERFTLWKQETYRKLSCWFWIPIVKASIPQDDNQGVCCEVAEESTPFRSLWHELQGEHCKDVIRSALNLLELLPILHRQNNPHNGQDRTFWYRLDLAVLEALKAQYLEKKRSKPLRGAIDDIQLSEDEIQSSEDGISPTISEIISEPFLKQPIAAALKSDQKEEKSSDRLLDQPQPRSKNRPVQPKNVGTDLISSEVAAAFAELKIEVNATILKMVKQHPTRLHDAIAVVKQEVAKRWVMEPAAVFVCAIRRGQKPKGEVTGRNGSHQLFVADNHDEDGKARLRSMIEEHFQFPGAGSVAVVPYQEDKDRSEDDEDYENGRLKSKNYFHFPGQTDILIAPDEPKPIDPLTQAWGCVQVWLALKLDQKIKATLDRLLEQGEAAIVDQLLSLLKEKGSLWCVESGEVQLSTAQASGEGDA